MVAGLDTSGWSMCPDSALDPLGHHAVTCRHEEMWSYAIREMSEARPFDCKAVRRVLQAHVMQHAR